MKIFLLDLWHDLLEKRLWPVALVLLAGLVAVPVLLAKPAEQPRPAPAPPATAKKPDRDQLAALAQVKLGEEDRSGSTLGVFDPSDPFKPPKGTFKKPDSGDSTGAGPGSDTSAGGDTFGGGTGGATGDTGTTFGGGTTGGGDTGGGTTGGDDTGGDDTTTTTTQYAYVIDVTFTANGRTRRIKGMQKLDLLPSTASPLLLFLGVSSNAGNAVFLVDSTLDAAGEGSCKPSRDDCAFLYLGAGSEHEFTNADGDSYQLKIDQIRKVKVGARASAGSSRDERVDANAAVGPSPAPRRFVPPLLADLVSVSSTTAGASDSNRDRR